MSEGQERERGFENEAKDKGASRSSNRAEHGVSTSPGGVTDHLYSGTPLIRRGAARSPSRARPLSHSPSYHLSPAPTLFLVALA